MLISVELSHNESILKFSKIVYICNSGNNNEQSVGVTHTVVNNIKDSHHSSANGDENVKKPQIHYGQGDYDDIFDLPAINEPVTKISVKNITNFFINSNVKERESTNGRNDNHFKANFTSTIEGIS